MFKGSYHADKEFMSRKVKPNVFLLTLALLNSWDLPYLMVKKMKKKIQSHTDIQQLIEACQ